MRKIKIGQKYKHFKGHQVIVELIAKDTETLEDLVVYKHLDKNEYWVRPYNIFNSEIDHNKYPDINQKYRFEEMN